MAYAIDHPDETAQIMVKYNPTLSADLSGIISRISTGALGPDDVVAMTREVGASRVLFGTNYPLVDQVASISLYSSYSYLFRERTRRLDV